MTGSVKLDPKMKCALEKLDEKNIKKVELNTSNDYWLIDPLFKIKIMDLEKLKDIIYIGNSSHNNSHFQERYEEGKLKMRFKIPFCF